MPFNLSNIHSERITRVYVTDKTTSPPTEYLLGAVGEYNVHQYVKPFEITANDGTTVARWWDVDLTLPMLETDANSLLNLYDQVTSKRADVLIVGNKSFAFYDVSISIEHDRGNRKTASTVTLHVKGGHKSLNSASGLLSTVIPDKDGNPNEMVFIPAFRTDTNYTTIIPVTNPKDTNVHPAFIVNGQRIPGFWVAKYQACLIDANGNVQTPTTARDTDASITGSGLRASSRYWRPPQVNIDFPRAQLACSQMNGGNITGFHLMTNAERAAIALWVALTGTPRPRGNNNRGSDYYDPTVVGTVVPGFGANAWYSGSGGLSTSHNQLANGVFDLNGNVWQWMDGLQVVNGRIYVAGNLNASPTGAGNGFGVSSANYYDTGWFYAWDTAGSVYLSTTGPGTGSGGITVDFVSVTGGGSDTLKQLALAPIGGSFNDALQVATNQTSTATFGGAQTNGIAAGVNAINLVEVASNARSYIGFRCAYIGNI
jgi:hypothetical protein